jgi:hypothetical protein
MATELLAADDSRWRLFLERARHDTYHHPEYARVAAQYEGGEPFAFHVDDGDSALLMPLLVRELPPELGAPREWRDATSPYGYSGPIATRGVDDYTLRCSLASLHEIARERSIVSAFIRMNPFCPVPAQAFAEIGTVVNHGPVVYVDLTKSLDQLWAETRSNHRRNITRLIRLGYSVEMDDWNSYPVFRELYRRTMERRSASAFYFFSDEYFNELREMLGDHLHLCTVRAPQGDIAASGLFMLSNGIAEYHLGGTADDHLARAPSKLMFDFVRRWAKETGASVLNLGGGVGGSAGPLQQFKTGFSEAQADFHTVRIVFDHEGYQRLVAASRQIRSVDDAHDSFFPAYRQAYTNGDDA